MIYKSYLDEENFKLIKSNIVLFYGENLGLKNDFKDKIKIENKDYEIIYLEQESLIKDNSLLVNEIDKLSLFNNKKFCSKSSK